MAILRNDTVFMDGNNSFTVKELVEKSGSKKDDIPRVYLFDGLLPIDKTNQKMRMVYTSNEETFECWITIKCQGTSSMAYDKKNFSIKLYNDEALTSSLKKDFKGWGRQNKFVWKANYIDISHARNIVSARLWADCVKERPNFDSLPEELKTSPNYGAIDGFFIKVYHEGVYQGRYTWNIPKDPWMTNMDNTLEEHCLLCGEDYGSSCFRAPAVIDESDWTDEIHSTCPESIVTRWNQVIEFVRTSSDSDFKNNLDNYLDSLSLIDYYIFHYVCCGLDALGKNQVYITYDGMKWYATSYDMDSTWGLYWDGASLVSPAYRMQQDYEVGVHGTSNLLYDRLEKLFKTEIQERYAALRRGALSLNHIIDRFEDFMICSEELVREDYAIFPNIPGQTINNLQQIRQYAADRLNYVDGCINAFNAPPITANKIYELPAETVFDGTSTFIDTGVKLFDTAKDWTIIAHGNMDTVAQAQNTAIMHCIDEGNTAYPGITLQYNANDAGYTISGNYGFANSFINSASVKFGLTCKDGHIRTYKHSGSGGVQTFKATKASYRATETSLVIGAYTSGTGEHGRYWNGTMYSFDIYDDVLTDGQINNALNSMVTPGRVFRDGYSPNGATFTNTASIDWSSQELYITMNLNACTGTNENLISIGNNIGTWSRTDNIHFYYTKANSTLIIQGGGGTLFSLSAISGGDISIILNSNGLYINDTLYSRNDYALISNVLNMNTVEIGSTEGATRSKATNYHIELRSRA